MAGSGYHKIGDQMAVHSLNEIFGRKLDLNYRKVAGSRGKLIYLGVVGCNY